MGAAPLKRPDESLRPPPRDSVEVRILLILFAAVALRLLFHAVYVPAYEGPDEPGHLGRAVSLAGGPIRDGLLGDSLPGEIAGSLLAHPCGPDLESSLGCPPFRGSGAFNVLAPDRPAPHGPLANYESHQPPLCYVAVAAVFRILDGGAPTPVSRLLVFRLLSVLFVLAALAFPLRRLSPLGPPGSAVVFLLLLLLPGCAEALARASNDAAVFLWTAVIVERSVRRASGWTLAALLAIGPLLKLTAFPVAAVVVAMLWLGRRRTAAAAGAVASLSVFAVQAIRGWAWGGTYELNRGSGAFLSGAGTAAGALRSLYTFVKTVFWLGEWSFFRAPLYLVIGWFAVLLVLVVRLVRSGSSDSPIPAAANRIGASVAAAGFLALAILNRRLFGDWGGLGGWYVWGWTPWIAVAGRSGLAGGRFWTPALGAFVLLANAAWFRSAIALYGI